MNWRIINLAITTVLLVAAIVMIFTSANVILWILIALLESHILIRDYKEFRQLKTKENE